ncbi:hypothetical protein EDD37DRAFT_121523 [Exophiala viscosa]|uniref:uncharacterized protein n=1 Tax=Exophiala viscosa TaxID=2486360 RepID=UPI002198FA55|nr:hypothetical protein EDD37DRAFT_121523 [Exophiala viscosa]
MLKTTEKSNLWLGLSRWISPRPWSWLTGAIGRSTSEFSGRQILQGSQNGYHTPPLPSLARVWKDCRRSYCTRYGYGSFSRLVTLKQNYCASFSSPVAPFLPVSFTSVFPHGLPAKDSQLRVTPCRSVSFGGLWHTFDPCLQSCSFNNKLTHIADSQAIVHRHLPIQTEQYQLSVEPASRAMKTDCRVRMRYTRLSLKSLGPDTLRMLIICPSVSV